ncbi:hypothetical protein [Agrobacterium sp. V1]|uniref:hypothetical protein n=1 Tax=Agrobacterium sp. V1 TaxID=3061957 RepID=UPI0026715FF9|nr:hypothetical protein [Agrobacterium sp. V1]MDO3441833.1 hypothetical protein [Agrobacterium sp. V1]
MQLAYSTSKIQKLATTEKELVKAFGANVAKAIQMRIAVLLAVPSLIDVPSEPPERRHLLIGKRNGQWSIAARNGICICVVPNQVPLPLNDDGSIDLTKVVSVEIVYIGDYHK